MKKKKKNWESQDKELVSYPLKVIPTEKKLRENKAVFGSM